MVQFGKWGDDMEKTFRNVPSEQSKKICKYFAGQPQVAAVYLFGSYGTEFQLPSSDIDLGIVFCDAPDLKDELELDAELSSFLHTDKIDLINLDRAPLNLQHRVLREGVLLLENDYITHSNFLEMVSKYYWDYQISHNKFMLNYEAALKEAYSSGR